MWSGLRLYFCQAACFTVAMRFILNCSRDGGEKFKASHGRPASEGSCFIIQRRASTRLPASDLNSVSVQ
ncbi:hypothetical protein O9929_11845 [Vibrio lentus]|nr:hypothetical protein [Vibrio lentus]